MSDSESDERIEIEFQWTVGDRQLLGKLISRPFIEDWGFLYRVVTRLCTFGIVFWLVTALIPDAGLSEALYITIGASFSIFALTGLELLLGRLIDNARAKDSKYVGWNKVLFSRRGIVWEDETRQEYVSWPGIVEIQFDEDRGVWAQTGPVDGFFVPARIFAGPSQFRKIKKQILEYQVNHTQPVHQLPSIGSEESEPSRVVN